MSVYLVKNTNIKTPDVKGKVKQIKNLTVNFDIPNDTMALNIKLNRDEVLSLGNSDLKKDSKNYNIGTSDGVCKLEGFEFVKYRVEIYISKNDLDGLQAAEKWRKLKEEFANTVVKEAIETEKDKEIKALKEEMERMKAMLKLQDNKQKSRYSKNK